jgi:hypothetical protein
MAPTTKVTQPNRHQQPKHYWVSPFVIEEIAEEIFHIRDILGVTCADMHYEQTGRWPEEINQLGHLYGELMEHVESQKQKLFKLKNQARLTSLMIC